MIVRCQDLRGGNPWVMDDLAHLLLVQDGVVCRRQLLEIGLGDQDIRRMVRRRELTRVHTGVYVEHTGPLTWQQRAWAAVLVHWPAALTRESALPNPPERAPIQVAIDVRRSVQEVPGVRALRTTGFDERVNWLLSPPRVRVEHATLDVSAAAEDEAAAFQALAAVCQARVTTAAQLAAVLAGRGRVARGSWLRDVLTDLEAGACSVLEHGYLTRVERPHGLPRPARQPHDRIDGRRCFRDVHYKDYRTIVELDGRAFHDTAAARDRDFERDLAAAVHGEDLTLRLTYGQVFRTPCRTARGVAAVLHRRGWNEPFRACPTC